MNGAPPAPISSAPSSPPSSPPSLRPPDRPPILAALLSLLLPGLGQILLGRRERGLALVAAALGAILVLYRWGQPAAWLALLPLWLASAHDGWSLAAGRRPHTAALALLAALPIYLAGWQATDFAPQKLVTQFARVQPLFVNLLKPDLLEANRDNREARVEVKTPCPAGAAAGTAPSQPAASQPTASQPTVIVRPTCARLGEAVAVEAAGLPADSAVALIWVNPSDEETDLGSARTDGGGRLATRITVPVESIPSIYRDTVQTQHLMIRFTGPASGWRLNSNFEAILRNIGVTIALGLIATLFGALLALPLAVLGARNLMGANRLTLAVYSLVRMVLNVMRAIEPVILAVVFVKWVAQGPFAGVLALTVHAMAALGKLYSEAIEDIDPGPVEAVRAAGAGWLQTVVYAVLPQVFTPFLAFTVYRWDINVRMSTIIGFVGGGGIGFLLDQWIRHKDWSPTATAMLVIASVVIALDFLSAAIRARLLSGRPVVRPALKPVAYGLIIALVAWAWRTAELEPQLLVTGAPKIRTVVAQLIRPEFTTRAAITHTVSARLVVPCALEKELAGAVSSPPSGLGDSNGASPMAAGDSGGGAPSAAGETGPAPPATAGGDKGPTLSLNATCAEVDQVLTATAKGVAPNSRGLLSWLFPEGGRLNIGQIKTDAHGGYVQSVEIRPLLASAVQKAHAPVQLALEVQEVVAGVAPSEPLKKTLDQLVNTILMALIATTVGAALALPFGMLGARNIMPASPAGNAVYYAARMVLNLLRAVEPIIWAALFAAWVGYGSAFGGVMALVVVTFASLGKLFSEAVENIDAGPLEAISATGANRLQTIAYGVVPQIVPPFLAFGIYHWDINVRISTIVGFVGGGGIGFLLSQWMNQLKWSWASVAVFGIVVVVTAMDWLSLRVRERLVGG